MTYTQVWDHTNNQVSDTMILRDEDGAFIPFDLDNTDYQEYLAWLDEGNEPIPYVEPPLQPIVPPPSDKEVVTEALTNHEQRLTELESQVTQLTKAML
jgi:hypothetical protein